MGPPSQHTAQSAGLVALQRWGVTSRDLINGGSNHGYWRVVKVKVEDSPGHTLSGGDYPVGGDDGSSTAVRAGNLEADLPRPGPQGGQLSCRCPAGVHPASSVWKRRVLLEHSTATGFQRDKTYLKNFKCWKTSTTYWKKNSVITRQSLQLSLTMETTPRLDSGDRQPPAFNIRLKIFFLICWMHSTITLNH